MKFVFWRSGAGAFGFWGSAHAVQGSQRWQKTICSAFSGESRQWLQCMAQQRFHSIMSLKWRRSGMRSNIYIVVRYRCGLEI